MIKKNLLESFFHYPVTRMNKEPATHVFLGKKVYYKKHHRGVVEKWRGRYAGVVVCALKSRTKGAKVDLLVMKLGSRLDIARPDMVTIKKPRS